MDILYPSRSTFLDACEGAIREQQAMLIAGGLVHVDLREGDYEGRVVVTIQPADREVFGTNWDRDDPTRFPGAYQSGGCRAAELPSRGAVRGYSC
jgi:hypothetical protein